MRYLFQIYFRIIIHLSIFSGLLSYAQTSVNNSCYSVGEEISLNALPAKHSHLLNQSLAKNMFNDIISLKLPENGEFDITPWLLLNSPKKEVRKTAVFIQEFLAIRLLNYYKRYYFSARSRTEMRGLDGIDNVLNSTLDSSTLLKFYEQLLLINNPSVIMFEKSKGILSSRDSLSGKNSYYVKSREYGAQASRLLCSRFLNFECISHLNYIINLVMPNTATNWNSFSSPRKKTIAVTISLPDIINEVITDVSYIKPIAHLAVTLINKSQYAETNNIVSGGFFEDIKKSFIKFGFSHKESEQRAWKVIAFYSTRGASMSLLGDVVDPQTLPVILAMMSISSIVSYLDLYPLKDRASNEKYSLPRSIKSDCAYGKPYHFWMAAYLAWHLVNEKNASPKSAILATHLAGILYEMTSITYGRNPHLTLELPKNSIHNNSIRWSLIFKDAGARYGATYGKHVLNDNIDSLYMMNLNKGKSLNMKTEDTTPRDATEKSFFLNAIFMYRWEKVMVPHTYFSLLNI